MKKPLIIFGTGELAELAYFYFSKLGGRDVAGFCLDAKYIKNDHIMGLPVISLHEMATRFPAAGYEMFIAIGYSRVNRTRRDKYHEVKSLGYNLATYISPHAVVHTQQIGDNCLIMDANNIHPYTAIGNNVIFSNSNHIGHHSTIEDHCFITSNVVIGGGAHIGEGSFLGINSTIRDHVRIGRHNIVGAGALILHDTQDDKMFRMQQPEAQDISDPETLKL